MSGNRPRESVAAIASHARSAVRGLALARDWEQPLSAAVAAMLDAQERFCNDFPCIGEEVAFWETLWRSTDAVRDEWNKVARAARRRCEAAGRIVSNTSADACRELYHWTHRLILDRAPRKPSPPHFRLGIDRLDADCRRLHERIEGLYESIKRQGRFPAVKQGLDMPDNGVNFAIIYGAGWNVSAYSLLGAASELDGINALVAFDHRGSSLFGTSADGHTVRLAPAGLIRDEGGGSVLATFRGPQMLHFVCPHQWTGPAPHDIGVPVLRSALTVRVTSSKHLTTEALLEYRETHGVRLGMIDEEFVPSPEYPADIDTLSEAAGRAVGALAARGAVEIVVKPSRGEQARDVRDFTIPSQKEAAIRHAVGLALDSGALVQEKIVPDGGLDYNWRVFVAASPDGRPEVAGRFARIGRGDDMRMMAENDMLRLAGITPHEGARLMERMDAASIHAFHAISSYSRERMGDMPERPLGGSGAYHIPYFLGIDLIGNARIMEVNGSEVAGMWTDDRLYPRSRGRTSRRVLLSARRAGAAYQRAIGEQRAMSNER